MPTLPGQVAKSLFPLNLFSPLEHGRGEVDAGDVLGLSGEGAGHQAGAAGHVQHGVFRPDPGHLQQQFQEGLLGVGRLLRERHRLPAELVDDRGLMRLFLVVLHCLYFSVPVGSKPLPGLNLSRQAHHYGPMNLSADLQSFLGFL